MDYFCDIASPEHEQQCWATGIHQYAVSTKIRNVTAKQTTAAQLPGLVEGLTGGVWRNKAEPSSRAAGGT